MAQFLSNLLTASFHGSVVILAVIALRLLLRRTPKKYICLLWLLAGIRLLMPIEIRSDLSLQPEPEPIVQQLVFQEAPVTLPAEPEIPQRQVPEVQAPAQPAFDWQTPARVVSQPAEAALPQSPSRNPMTVPGLIWLGVAGLFFLYTLVSYVRLKLLVREAVKIEGGWESERIETAFILGFIRPQIYIPMGLSPTVRRHILAHERTHLDKGDHWFKMTGFLALALHWFNPLVWIAYILLCKDIELACDERVVQFMVLEERKEYSAALLNCSANRVHFAACPVAFGEVSVKERIKSVLRYRRPGFWISLAGVAAIAFVAVCLVTSPTEEAAAPANSVTVHNVDELLEAIGPNKEILLQPGTYDFSQAKTYGKEVPGGYCSWQGSYDGFELVLEGVDNLTVRGSGKVSATVQTQPRWANVLRIRNSTGVTLTGFTAGHTEAPGECSGGVIYLENCSDVSLDSLGLYGCGVVGVTAELCRDLSVTGSDIYQCSSSAASILSSSDVTLTGCRIYEIGRKDYGGYAFLEATDSRNVTVDSCDFSGSTLSHLLSAAASQVTLSSNLFTGNRVRSSAFSLSTQDVVLEGNRFEDNSVRAWYTGYGSTAFDPQGQPITEEALNEMYPAAPTDAAQPRLEIHVSTVDEFLAAIGPNRDIVLEGSFYDLSTATGYGTAGSDYYYWEDIYDGPGLVIRDVTNMTLRSSSGNRESLTISAVPRYADVLAFNACANVTLSGFTAGHTTEPGSCAGGVIELRDCDNMTVDNCSLYGCGILGVYAEYCRNIQVTGCDIYECSQGGIQMRNTANITVTGNTFRDLGGEKTSFIGCSGINLDGNLLNPPGETGLIQTDTQADAPSGDEQDLANLGSATMAFAGALFRGDEATVRLHLSEEYPLTPVIPEGLLGATLDTEQRRPENYAARMETMGCCLVPVSCTAADGSSHILTLEMCREQGVWKVQYYTSGQTEAEMLDTLLTAFLDAYLRQDVTRIERFLSADFSGSLPVYSGTGPDPEPDREYTVGSTFSNAQLARLDSYSAAVPFRENPDSAAFAYLNIALRRSASAKGGWEVLDYGTQSGADTPRQPEGLRVEHLDEENYTGVVMLIEDPARLFLGTSSPTGFSRDVPGKRIGEMLEASPDCVAAVNAGAFFDDGTASPAVGSCPLGLTVAGGEAVWDQGVIPGAEGFAGFDSENTLVVLNHGLTAQEAQALNIRDGCNIGPALIIDGAVQAAVYSNSGYAPRTAIGQTADGTVILLCINGRIFNSLGATYEDVANEMMHYGAVNACLLQGGSATAMMYRPLGEEARLLTSISSMNGEAEISPRRLPTYWMVAAR